MENTRREFRYETQSKYGNYCSYSRQQGKEPRPYTQFAELYISGLTVKQVYKKLHEST
jgi:hypothetical protein